MSPETPTQDRIYLAVKRDYLDGRFRPTERVDIKAIADRHLTSPTPVREVLSRFVGERLFEHRPEGGFRPSLPSADRLADLYALHRDAIAIALGHADTQHLRRVLANHRSRVREPDPVSTAHSIASFFASIADGARNIELHDHVQNLGERLLLPRIEESRVLDGLEQELKSMMRNGLVDIRNVVGKRVARYHDRRIARSSEIVEAMAQPA